MNCLYKLIYKPLIIIIGLLASLPVFSQLDRTDPFKDNYLLGNSAEIFVIRAAEDTMEFKVIDAVGNISTGGLEEKGSRLEVGEWAPLEYYSPVSIISGNFNDDKYTDVVAAWQGADSSVILYVPQIDPVSLTIDGAYKAHLPSTGLPEMYHRTSRLMRIISLEKGQFDTDREKEIVLAYMADYGNPDGGPVFIVIYDINKETGMPELKDSLSAVMLSPELWNAQNGLSRGSLFDIATGDFNQDGTDEIVLTTVTPIDKNDPDKRYGWRLDAYLYQIQNGEITFAVSTSEPIYSEPGNSNDHIVRLAVTAGNFDNDFLPDIAVSWELRLPSNGDSEFYMRVISANTDSITKYGSRHRYDGSNGNNGWPMSIKTGDFDLDGRDEIQLAARNNLRAYRVDDELNVMSNGSAVMGVSLSTNREDRYSETFAVADMDIGDNDTLKTEIITYDNYGIRVHQKRGYTFGNDLVGELEMEADAITTGDFDGDALRFGPPERQTRTDIIQPIMILSSPPLHIDVFDGVVYDLQDCYPVNDVTNITRCYSSHVSFTSVEGSRIESATEVRSTWRTSKTIAAQVSGKKGILSAKVSGSLNWKYGEGFKNVNGSAQEFELSAKSESREDDLIYCTVSDYELLRYPVYASDTLFGHVVAVLPGKTKEAWFSGRASAANDFHPNHEVGNILSYPKTTELPPGARPFGVGGYNGGSDTWTVSPSTIQNWNLKFGSETITERESFSSQSLTRKIEAEVGLKFKFVNASVKGSYQDTDFSKDISTHKTTIKKSSEVEISMGLINSSFVGTKTYDVTPFMYWDASGTLVLDYAVSPDFSGGVPSWWEEKYGSDPDLTFILPWRNRFSKGLGGGDNDLQAKQTRDIVVSPLDPLPGDTATIYARVQNYSNVDQYGTSLKFYLGDPDNGGQLITNKDGISEVILNQVNAREPVIAKLENWIVPTSIKNETMIFAVVDPDDLVEEVHENNNKAWSLIGSGFGTSTDTENLFPDNATSGNEKRVQLFPNPVQTEAVFRYSILTSNHAELSLFDMQGRQVELLFSELKSPGTYGQEISKENLEPGIYFYRFKAGDYIESGKMVILD
jgi:hypothetical protein